MEPELTPLMPPLKAVPLRGSPHFPTAAVTVSLGDYDAASGGQLMAVFSVLSTNLLHGLSESLLGVENKATPE